MNNGNDVEMFDENKNLIDEYMLKIFHVLNLDFTDKNLNVSTMFEKIENCVNTFMINIFIPKYY